MSIILGLGEQIHIQTHTHTYTHICIHTHNIKYFRMELEDNISTLGKKMVFIPDTH